MRSNKVFFFDKICFFFLEIFGGSSYKQRYEYRSLVFLYKTKNNDGDFTTLKHVALKTFNKKNKMNYDEYVFLLIETRLSILFEKMWIEKIILLYFYSYYRTAYFICLWIYTFRTQNFILLL